LKFGAEWTGENRRSAGVRGGTMFGERTDAKGLTGLDSIVRAGTVPMGKGLIYFGIKKNVKCSDRTSLNRRLMGEELGCCKLCAVEEDFRLDVRISKSGRPNGGRM